MAPSPPSGTPPSRIIDLGSPDQAAQSSDIPVHVHDDSYWSCPPPSEGNEPLWVDIRFNLNKVTSVDTVHGAAWVSIGIAFYWTDSRLRNWSRSDLPSKLWGPCCWLFNAHQDLQEVPQDFGLTDSSEGRMKRYCRYMGTVDNPMDLAQFPFDINTIDLRFRSASHWVCLDGSCKGDLAKGRAYFFRPCSRENEGDLFQLLWNGCIAEFDVLGISLGVEDKPATSSGQEVSELLFKFHIARKTGFYFWKVLMPIYMLAGLSLASFLLDVQAFGERMNMNVTLFLASFAMLYVLGEHLPKTDFLISVDLVIITTSVALLAACILAYVVKRAHEAEEEAEAGGPWDEPAGTRRADFLNMVFGTSLAALEVIANASILIPPWLRRRRDILSLREHLLSDRALPRRTAQASRDVKQAYSVGWAF